MMRRPPVSTRSDTLFPVTTLCRSIVAGGRSAELGAAERDLVGTGRARRPRHPLGRKAHRPARGAPPLAYVAQPLRPLVLLHVMRSEEHTSELQSLMRISYAVFCLKQNNI